MLSYKTSMYIAQFVGSMDTRQILLMSWSKGTPAELFHWSTSLLQSDCL